VLIVRLPNVVVVLPPIVPAPWKLILLVPEVKVPPLRLNDPPAGTLIVADPPSSVPLFRLIPPVPSVTAVVLMLTVPPPMVIAALPERFKPEPDAKVKVPPLTARVEPVLTVRVAPLLTVTIPLVMVKLAVLTLAPRRSLISYWTDVTRAGYPKPSRSIGIDCCLDSSYNGSCGIITGF
jgi:hypothetical protein